MKYFTRECSSGSLSDEEFERTITAYWKHIELLSPRFSESIAELAYHISLHDALIRQVSTNLEKRQLTLELLCGDLQQGYFDLTLYYSGVRFETLDVSVLQSRTADRRTEFLYDELDVENDAFVHRILFYPQDEIAITFLELRLTRVPRPDRAL